MKPALPRTRLSLERTALLVLGLLGALSALAVIVPERREAPNPLTRVVHLLRKSRVSRQEAEAETAGYYEDLFRQSSRAISTAQAVTGRWTTDWTHCESKRLEADHHRVGGFLHYELKRNLDVPGRYGPVRTNRHGLADREYALAPPEGTRRLALLGDSMARGVGSSPGKNYESLLEDALNRAPPQGGAGAYEILNFGVEGYRITQIVDVFLEKAARFAPHAYLVVFSDLTVFRKWGDHLGQLVHDGVDLKYPYLRELARRAGLRPDDDPATLDARLASFRTEVLVWALETMRDAARARGAQLLILLVPTADEPEALRERFAELPGLLRSEGIPFVDLVETFADAEDLASLQVGPLDRHPNDRGHELLFQRLLERLRGDPLPWSIVTGVPSR